MTEAADRVFTNARVHTLADEFDPGSPAEAVAVRDGRVVAVGRAEEVAFRVGVETETVDLDGRALLPGFVDAHTHLLAVGQRLANADLTGAEGREECIERLRAPGDAREEWILGFGYDESAWDDGRPLTATDLDAVSEDRPVAAFREDMHVVSLNAVALERLRPELPAADVRTEGGDPTGVVGEGAADAVRDAIAPDRERARDRLLAAQDHALARGVTGVHEMVARPPVARAWRDLDATDHLALRVRLNYWADHLDAVSATGLRPNHGTERVRVGAIKTMADGSLGGHTARLAESYTDRDVVGEWVTDPADLASFADTVADADLQAAVHAIGDAAVDATLSAFADADRGARHRIEHAEVQPGDLPERLAASPLVVSAQPNFLKWAGEGGLYAERLGERPTNRYRDLLDAGATLAFGSDCMPLDPLFGIEQAVTAPDERQRLTVTEALRAYTRGSAYAGFDEDRLGTVEPGKRADFVVLEASPWDVAPAEVGDLSVAMTVVDGTVVHDAR